MLILCSFSVFGQNTIRGTVVDNVGQPIIGATVLVKSTNNGVVTNTQGEFSFTADTPLPITLSVSLIGYRTQEIDVYDAEEPITVLLLEELNYLKEVVVVGYDTQTRKEFTGSAARITSDAIRDVPVQSFEQALSGVAAGVNISVPNGILNNPPLIRIRGVNSISLSSYPLIIVDGIPVSTGDISTNTNIANNPLGDINPSDIESVDVLKDAASTSIYGSRAAAGVIIITTKRGKTGKAKTTYEGWVGVTNATRLPELLNAQQYIDIKNEAVLNSKILTGNANNDNVSAALYFPSYNNDGSLVDTRWYDHVYRTAVSHNHALTISGGNASTNYYFSANYTDQEGFLIGNDFERKGVRLNIDQKVTDWFKLKGTASYNTSLNKSYSSGSLAGSSQFLTAAARLAISLPPNVAPYNHSDGSYNLSPTGTLGAGSNLVASTLYNPVALFDYTSISSSNDRFLGSLNANLKILNRFDYNITYALDRLKGENVSYLSPLLGSSGYGVGGSATNISVLLNNTAFTNTLAYSNKINKNNLSVLIGTDLQQFVTDIWGVYATKSTDEFFKYYQGGWANITSSGNKRGERVYLSYFSRINYNFDDKYFFTGNFRRDGNSALAEGNKYGNFGGVSAGWALSQEDFYKNSSLVQIFNNVKINASWGRVGNANLTNDYASYNLYSASLYGDQAAWILNQSGNSDLTWETSEQTNIGLTIDAFRDKIQFEFAYFYNNVNGLILETPQSPSKGIPDNTILSNVGSLYNKGVELGINANVFNSKYFSWDVSFNTTHIENKVTALADGDIIGYTHTSANSNNITRVGYSVGSLYGAKTDGVNPANGRRIFINAAGEKVQYSAAVAPGESNWTYLDGTTAPAISASDYYVLGNTSPKWYGGFINNFRYKNFDLNLNFNYALGFHVMNGTKGTLRDQTTFNNHTDILNRWTTEGQVTNIPRLVYTDVISNGSAFPISENVERGDFLRLNNVILGYKIPEQTFSKLGLSSIRVYTQVSNAFLITKYSGTDPESSTNGNSTTSPGVERNSVGRGRTFTLGLSVAF